MSPLSVDIFSTIGSTCVMLVGPMMSGFTSAVVTGMHSTRVMRIDLIDPLLLFLRFQLFSIINSFFYKVKYNDNMNRTASDSDALPDYEVVKYRMAGIFLTSANDDESAKPLVRSRWGF